jgi:hypothetical protein
VRDACSQKVSKNPKIVCAQVTLTKTGLSAVWTFCPLGVKVEVVQGINFPQFVNPTQL